MKNIKVLIFAIVLVVIFWGVVYSQKTKSTEISDKTLVTTSFYPLYYFTSQIGGDKVTVINLTPAGVEPHDYELSTNDLINIQKSKLLVLNGSGLESWSEKVKSIVAGKGVDIVDASLGVAHINGYESDPLKVDPHVWLDPIYAKEESQKILAGLISVDPSNKDYYMENFSKLEKELEDLDRSFRTGLSHCALNTIVTSHSAFGYLADRYNLVQISIAGLSPDIEPSPRQLAQITDTVRKKNIKYIFFEELTSPDISNALAKETNTKTIVFDPLEGLTKDKKEKGENYLSIHRQNLKNLMTALECK